MNRSELIDRLLSDRSHHIEFNGHLTNHVKHAVVALAGLGATAERIQEYHDNYVKMTPYGFPLEPPKPSEHTISDANWDHLLGQRTSFSSYCDYFDRLERQHGLSEVVRRYAPRLLAGWPGAFTHAAIHLGWALDAGSRRMAVEGLAYMAFSYDSCRPQRAVPGGVDATDERPVDSLLRIAGAWDADRAALRQWAEELAADVDAGLAAGIHPELVRSGLQFRIARVLAEGHPLIQDVPAWIDAQDAPTSWSELYEVVTLLYLAVPGDFILLHLITALYGMEQIAAHLPADQQRYAVTCFWMGMLAIVFSGGDFPSRATLAELRSRYEDAVDAGGRATSGEEWEHIVARALEEEEEHNPKMVYVLRQVWQRSGFRSLYRDAAARFTTTPELPESFDEPPVG